MTAGALYELLGIEQSASAIDIKRAYRSIAKAAHPDAGGDPEGFIELTRAYNTLSDPERRARYDQTGEIDDDAVNNDHVALIQMLSSCLDQVLNQNTVPISQIDVIGKMREAITQKKRSTEAELDGLTARLKGLGELRKRIIRKDEAENLFVKMIDNHVKQAAADQAEFKRALRVFTRASEELASYESVVDVVRFVQAGMYSSYSTGTATFWDLSTT